jgi:hypothetical protein
MSPRINDWTTPETEAPSRHSSKDFQKYSRQEEFRFALDSYIREYADHQKRRAEAIGNSSPCQIRHPAVTPLAQWFWRRISGGTRLASAPVAAQPSNMAGPNESLSAANVSTGLNDNASDLADLLPQDVLWLGG